MLTARQVLYVLESVREIPSIVQCDEEDIDLVVDTALNRDTKIYHHIGDTFKVLMRTGDEEASTSDFVKSYPYMIYNDELPGHISVILSENEALIHEFELKECRESNESDAYNFMLETASSGYLGNDRGGILRYVPISESIPLSKINDLIDSSCDKLVQSVDNASNEELSTSVTLNESEYGNVNISTVRMKLTQLIRELHKIVTLSIK